MYQAQIVPQKLVVGSDHDGDVSVYVSEYVSDIERSARGQVFWRLARIVLLAAVATGVVNLVFLRMAAKPLEKLVDTVRRIAQGQLGAQAGPFKAAELEYLADEINSMSSSLAESDLQRCREMAKARRIQEHLLPKGIEVPGLTLAHLYQPATEVAGDYFDIVALPDQTWLLCIADVSGHGVPAAMTASMLKTLLLHAIEHHVTPDRILCFINDRFAAVSLEGDFATMLLAPDPRDQNPGICQCRSWTSLVPVVGQRGDTRIVLHGRAVGSPTERPLGVEDASRRSRRTIVVGD